MSVPTQMLCAICALLEMRFEKFQLSVQSDSPPPPPPDEPEETSLQEAVLIQKMDANIKVTNFACGESSLI